MKKNLFFAALLIAFAGVLCGYALAQQVVVSQPIGTNQSSEYLQPGDTSTRMATVVSTNAPVFVMPPIVRRAETLLITIQNWLTGAATLIAALLAWWGKKGNDRAATLPVLIRAIENFDSKVLKASIEADAKDKGVDKALHEAVRENTSVSPRNDGLNVTGDPLPPTPVVPVANPHEIRPI